MRPMARSRSWLLLVVAQTPLLEAQPPGPYKLWLTEDVTYIIQANERKAFEALQTDPERERFIVQFWKRRDPTPATDENEAREEHYRRIQRANEKFREAGSGRAGWRTERGRAYILYGPPDELEVHPEQSKEKWLYRHIPGKGDRVILEFDTGPRR